LVSQSRTSTKTISETLPVLEAQDLSYSYEKSKLIFKDVNLVTQKDQMVAIIGPTGTGKSSLLRVLAGLNPPTSGRVLLNGEEVKEPSGKIALVHQSIATFPWKTALDNVKLVLLGSQMPDEKATRVAKSMLELVGLKGSEQKYPKEMSGGMRQRVAIARALAGSPEVLLLDEPFVHLDWVTANEIRKEIRDLVFNPKTTLHSAVLVTHDLHEVVLLADRVYILNGSPATVFDTIDIELPKRRNEHDPSFFEYVDRLYEGLVQCKKENQAKDHPKKKQQGSNNNNKE
jgi:NitT/TauT family transport system ATP-binding protein